MNRGPDETVRSRKRGSENGIVVQLPSGRFAGMIPPRHSPTIDEQDRHRVMILAQDCTRCSFGDREVGRTRELHLWLHVGSSSAAPAIENADVMLPSQAWLALVAATDNPRVEASLRSFGFDPLPLESVSLRSSGGELELHEGAGLRWTVTGPGRGPATIGVHHALFMPDDGSGAAGHRVAALVSDAVMGQPGELVVHGSALEPFLLAGERLDALVHRMPTLDADIVWRPRSTRP